ncbi:hypothetical protein FRC02_011542 [Tulasnella sp. 418]|nr:hypothetical protein FRC02_011542 [Tulasnella sp. 418]
MNDGFIALFRRWVVKSLWLEKALSQLIRTHYMTMWLIGKRNNMAEYKILDVMADEEKDCPIARRELILSILHSLRFIIYMDTLGAIRVSQITSSSMNWFECSSRLLLPRSL